MPARFCTAVDEEDEEGDEGDTFGDLPHNNAGRLVAANSSKLQRAASILATKSKWKRDRDYGETSLFCLSKDGTVSVWEVNPRAPGDATLVDCLPVAVQNPTALDAVQAGQGDAGWTLCVAGGTGTSTIAYHREQATN